MKRIILFTILFVPHLSFAQKEATYITYHKHIIAAEQQFLYHKNPKAALEKYREIFMQWQRPFARDCYIALQLACLMNDTAYATFFFEQCFKNGVEWNTAIFSPPVNRLLQADGAYKKRIGELCDKRYPEYLKTIDTVYRNVIQNMYKHEGRLRSYASGEEGNIRPKTREWMRIQDSNMYELVSMIKSKGFPGEKRVGYRNIVYKQIEDSRRGNRKYEYDFMMVDLFLSCHVATLFFHHRCGYRLLKEELMQAVFEGELHPREYALMYEWSHDYFAVKHWDDDYHDFRCEAEKQENNYNIFINRFRYSNDTEAVNKDRAEIGMCTLDHDEKKKKFAKDNELYLYFGMFSRI